MKILPGKKSFPMLIVIFFSLIISGNAQTFSTNTYAADDSSFPNPERGFYHHTETRSGTYAPLDQTTLRSFRNEGISLILRVFYLEKFVSQEISAEYLASMQQDFNSIRTAGLKVIVRFAYTQKSTSPYGDAPPEIVLKHINQLSPILHKNVDVINVVQAGFIGAWGEWYYTDYFSRSPGSVSESDWVNRRAVINALLDAVPTSRMIQLRTPAIKYKITNSTDALTQTDAFSGTMNARLAHHNDCFLASADDYGTYTGNMVQEKNYLEQETNYVPIGGETCGVDVPLSECPNALAQMQRFHWSFLNRDYNPDVLTTWQTGSCMPDVFLKLGYRFRMTNSKLQQDSKPGGKVTFAFNVLNEGWANLYNPRKVEIVLKNLTTNKEYFLRTTEDPRQWSLSDTTKIQFTAGLPAAIEEGDYSVHLNMPDPESALYNNPDYSIRMANTDVWDAQTGYNNLHHTITVSKTSTVPAYTGTDFFLSRPIVPAFTQISTDGFSNDWQTVEPLAVAGNQALQSLKIYNDDDSLYVLVTGTSLQQKFQLFINADQVSSTGYNAWQWAANGADYLIENNVFYSYTGTASAWGWGNARPIALKRKDDLIELAMPLSFFTGVSAGSEIGVAFVHDPDAVIKSTYLPLQNSYFLPYRLLLGSSIVKATSSGNKIILYWGQREGNSYTVLERSLNGVDYSTIVALAPSEFYYVDANLANATSYTYRMHALDLNEMRVSPYSDGVTMSTKTKPSYYKFETDGNSAEWEGVIPAATKVEHKVTTAYRLFISVDKLNVLWEGEIPKQYEIYLDIDNSESTGMTSPYLTYNGFDYKLSNDSLFAIENTSWKFISKNDHAAAGEFYEVSVPIAQVELLGQNTILRTSAMLTTSNNNVLYFPDVDMQPATVIRLLPSSKPAITISNSKSLPESQLIVQWSVCSLCNGFVIERSVGNINNFVVVAERNASSYTFYDNGLEAGVTYYYRVLSYNDAGPSDYSDIKSSTPGITTAVEPDAIKGIMLYPNPFTDKLIISSTSTEAIHVEFRDVQGRTIDTPMSEKSINGIQYNLSGFNPGIYIVKVSVDGRFRNFKILKY